MARGIIITIDNYKASSLCLIVGESTNTLGGVYTTAFLCVMGLFSIGNMLLKYKRSKLPREVTFYLFNYVITHFLYLGGSAVDSRYFCLFGSTYWVRWQPPQQY